ncbi:MAG: VWA domain-containing protein [Acidobacteriaceae bacterium]
MNSQLRRLIVCGTLGIASLSLWAQPYGQAPSSDAAPQVQIPEANVPIDQGPISTLSVDASLVNVDVLVTDDDGRVLSGLKRGNFRILDNGEPREIQSFAPTSAPITIVMLMEYSNIAYQYFAYKAAYWGSGFLNHLEPRDWVALVTYDIKPTVQVDFTHNFAEVRGTLARLGFPSFSESNMFDAILETMDHLENVRGRKSILLIATGANTFSSANLDDVINRLKRSDVTVFCVGLAEEEYVRSSGSSIGYMQTKSWLNSFAERTGGIAYFPRFQGELPDIFRSVAAFLRSEYTLSFIPPKASQDGRYHRLKVEIIGPDGKPLKVTDEKGKRHKINVYAREGYMAPKEKTASP